MAVILAGCFNFIYLIQHQTNSGLLLWSLFLLTFYAFLYYFLSFQRKSLQTERNGGIKYKTLILPFKSPVVEVQGSLVAM